MTLGFVSLNAIERDCQGLCQTYLQYHTTGSNEKLKIVCSCVREEMNKSQCVYSMEFYAAV